MYIPINNFQRGQVLPLTLVLLIVVAAVIFFMFNSGQLVQQKMGLTNTADAVAYSAGVYEARVLNYDAYANRAMIANEIAIGQAVGLASWAKYAGVSADTIRPYANYIPWVGPYVASALQQIKNAMDKILTPLAMSVSVHDAAIVALKNSQLALHGPSNAFVLAERKVLMNEVARKNDADVVVDTIPINDNFLGFTSRYENAARQPMKDVVNESREAFLKSRRWGEDLTLSLVCKIGWDFEKRGSTELVGLDGWKSMDTLSIHSYWIKWKWSGPKCKHSETPLGYGTAFSKNNLADGTINYAGSRNTNPTASRYADSSNGRAQGFAPSTLSGGAMPEFYNLSANALAQADPRTQITIRVTKPQGKQRYSGGSSIVRPTGELALYSGRHVGGESAAIARAEVYFERPDGANSLYNKAELGSLFNPYWQVHLVSVSASERAIALARQGIK
jgi:hypothetical protein